MNDKDKILNIEEFINIVKHLKNSFAGQKEISEEELNKIRKNLNSMKESIERSMESNKDENK